MAQTDSQSPGPGAYNIGSSVGEGPQYSLHGPKDRAFVNSGAILQYAIDS